LNERLSASELLGLYRQVLLIRRFEETVEGLFAGGELAGTTHACSGQEAVAVGVTGALAGGDLVVSNHRGHGHLLARGGDPGRLMAELFGRRNGYSLGRGGSQHVACAEIGFLGANGITGGGIPVATGQALALKRLGPDASPAGSSGGWSTAAGARIVCCFFGDGASNQGTFAESLNMAALWKLPVLYVLENNCWAFSTRTEDGCALPANGCRELAGRAAPFGIASAGVDGNDVEAVLTAARVAAAHVRSGEGPYLLECRTYRLSGHSKSDGCEYRSDREDAERRAACPLCVLRARMAEESVAAADVAGAEAEVAARVDKALEFARGSEVAETSEAAARVYASPVEGGSADPTAEDPGDAEEIYGWEAVQRALREELDRDPRVILLGEDIAEYGGAFKVTRKMAADYGPERVVNTPISENSVVGAAAGAAMLGMRPVVEIMFADFALLAFDQLANGAAKFHYMYAGQVNVPLTVRMPTGGYRGYGPTHSQCLEGFFQGVPGLKIVAPSSPRQARALLKAAIRDEDPVLFIEHKLLYGAREAVPRAEEVAPIGRARIVRTGGDLTIAAHGHMVRLAELAAEALAGEGVDAEVLDLRTLKPLDEEAILESVSRTMHLVTVEEGPSSGGIGAEVAARVAEKAVGYLDGPVIRVGAPDSPVPAARPLEDAVLPSPAKIVAAARRALGG
jgi:pyruvate/2-oxoglutarate/acetoin dehydrogenase E1 component/TPP-dependent pyruvate/acetoin dehydrogenase alpha subunit